MLDLDAFSLSGVYRHFGEWTCSSKRAPSNEATLRLGE